MRVMMEESDYERLESVIVQEDVDALLFLCSFLVAMNVKLERM